MEKYLVEEVSASDPKIFEKYLNWGVQNEAKLISVCVRTRTVVEYFVVVWQVEEFEFEPTWEKFYDEVLYGR